MILLLSRQFIWTATTTTTKYPKILTEESIWQKNERCGGLGVFFKNQTSSRSQGWHHVTDKVVVNRAHLEIYISQGRVPIFKGTEKKNYISILLTFAEIWSYWDHLLVQNEKYLALPMYALKVSCPHAASRWGENGLTMTNAVKALKPFQQLLTFLHFDIERFERKRFLGDIIMNIYFSNLSPG